MVSTIKKSLLAALFAAEGHSFAQRFNAINALRWRFPIRVEWHPANGLYSVSDGVQRWFFARRERVFRYYQGIDKKLADLGNQYFLPRIPVRPGDFVIDCGANVGEFGKRAQVTTGCRLISVEPEPREAICLAKNVPNDNHVVQMALWNQEGPVTLYSKNASGDSSLIQPSGYGRSETIQATTVSRLIAESGANRIRLLKLEAEGAEPEVLDGAGQSLSRIDFITADLGFERGLRESSTAVPVIDFLYARGFVLLDMSFDRVVCLFRHREAPE